MGLLIGLTIVLTGCSNPESNTKGLNENQIGWYMEMPSNESFTNYKLMTPRGLELVAGTTNLNNSINEYIKYDVFGKEVNKLNPSQKKRFRVKI